MRRAIVLLLLVAPAAAAATLPSGYYLIRPGGSYLIEPLLHRQVEHRRAMGKLAFTVVTIEPGTWSELIAARLTATATIVPAETVRPHGISEAELQEINRRLMEESKLVAAVVALRAAGYPAELAGQGAAVVGVLPGSPAEGQLQSGDVVLAVDGAPVGTAVELAEAVRRHRVGDRVRLTVSRGGSSVEVEVGTISAPDEPERPIVGARVISHQLDARLPFDVTLDTQNVGGPSAGLMFALAILDAVTDGVLTRGYSVAGTGTIAPDGTVGPVSGAPEKVVAAERDGAQLFFVPAADVAAARRAARSARVVPVERLGDAVRFLCGLEPLPDAPPEPPAPCPGTEVAPPAGAGGARTT